MNLIDEDAVGLAIARKLKTCVRSNPTGVDAMQTRLLSELHAGHRATSRRHVFIAIGCGILSAVTFAAWQAIVPITGRESVSAEAGEMSSEAQQAVANNPRTLGVSLSKEPVGRMVMRQTIASLADAVANAANGETIELDEGTYTLTDTISIVNKSLTLKGAPGAARERVVIDGDGAKTHRRCFYVNNTADYAVRFEGLTISNGFECGESGLGNYAGGGIWSKGPLTVSDCVISHCVVSNGVVKETSMGGGGIYVAAMDAVDVLIEDSLFYSNVVAYVTTTAPDRGKEASAYGGGFYVNGTSRARYRVENCVVSNCIGNANWSRLDSQFSRGTPGCSGGYAVSATVSGCRFVRNGYHGGTTTFSGTLGLSAAMVTNSYFEGNNANVGGAILTLSKSASYVVDCTVTNNRSGRGGGVAVPTGCVLDMRNTLIVGNFGSGAGVFICGTDTIVSNCVIRNNVAGSKVTGGGVYFSPMDTLPCKDNVVVRSVIAGNSSGGSGAGVMLGNYTTNNKVLDSIIANNVYTGGNGIGIAYVVDGANAKDNVLRNSLLTGNTQYADGSMPIVAFRCNTPAATLGTFSISIENCTIAGNDLKGCRFVIGDPNSKMPNGYDAVRLYNNIIAGNTRTKTKAYPEDPYGVQSCFMVANNRIKANLVDRDNWNENVKADNFVGDPLFEGVATGDYRLSKRSPALNCAIADTSWATKNAMDMGDGTYTVTTHAEDPSVPEYGIRLAFNNVQHRVSGDGLDLGCFERAGKAGLVVIIR